MGYSALKYSKSGQVLIVSIIKMLDDDGTTIRLASELADLAKEIMWDDQINAAILTGASDDTFSVLADPKAALSLLSSEWDVVPVKPAEVIAGFEQPVIAAIQGEAIGQGLEVLLACDLRIGDASCSFGFPQIKDGYIPWDGGTQRLSRVVGKAKTMEMLLTGEIIDAQEALRINLINKIVPSGEVMCFVKNMAADIASRGPISLKYTKEAVYKGMDLTLNQGLRLEADLYLHLHTTEDRTEGIRAFLEKRKPEFKGK
jgi:enoyl-CoA hydratase/carnithine racemase